MADIIFATTNKNKISRINNFMRGTSYIFHSLDEYGDNFPEPEETQDTPVLIAKNKSKHYFNLINNDIPVLAQDDTISLFINNQEEKLLSIKNPVKKQFGEFNDVNAIKYYTKLAEDNGGSIKMIFNYGFGLTTKDNNIAKSATLEGILVSQASKTIQPGYFLTAIFKTENKDSTLKYMSEMNDEENAYADKDLRKAVVELLNSLDQ